MIQTNTLSRTLTFSRTDYLAFQINYVFKEATGNTDFERIVKAGIVDKQWIDRINIDAIDASEKIRARITMAIDWGRHQMHISVGRKTIQLDPNAPIEKQLSVALTEIAKFFAKIVRDTGLRTKWGFTFLPSVSEAEANTIRGSLGLIVRQPVWAEGERVSVLSDVSDKTDEFSIELQMVVPEE